MHPLRSPFLLFAALLPLLLAGCVNPGYPYAAAPYSAPPAFVIAPTLYPGHGYGYWYGGRFCAYRNGYYFHNGYYYHGNSYRYHRGYWR